MSTQPSAEPVAFRDAFRFWLKLGFISFGGPAGQIAIMHRELVEQKRWISEARFLHALNYCMLLPGPEAQQLATYIGWLMHRTRGGIVAGVLFVLPSLFILIALSWIYVAFGNVPWVAGLLYGIKPAVAAIVLQAVHRIGSKTLKKPAVAPVLWAVAAMSFIAIYAFDVPFPWIVLCAAIVGWLGSKWVPAQFSGAAGHGSAKTLALAPGERDWVIGDYTPMPEHARFKPSRLATVLAIGLALWLLPMGLLVAWQGWHGALTQMGWFFTKAALLTFGGAYAVLPYVYQGAVEQFQWLTGLQMIDGLALGETTPGPLIMVVAFVGFVGGWTKQVLGPEALFLGAALAATVVTWFTFLPSFVFILAGGAAGGVDARQAAIYRAADGHHCRRGGCGRQSCSVFYSAYRNPDGGYRPICFPTGLGGAGYCRSRSPCTAALQAGRDTRHCGVRAGGSVRPVAGLGVARSRYWGTKPLDLMMRAQVWL